MGFVINSKGFSCRPDKGNARGAHGSVSRADSQITSAPKPMAKVGHMERKLHEPTGPNGQAHEDFSRTGNNGEVPRPFSMSKGLDASWLPAALQEIQSSSQTGLSDGSLLPAVLATAGTAMGSSAVLQSQLFSMPVNASIQALIYCPQGHRLKGATDEITKPLRLAQDERLVERGEVRTKDVDKKTRQVPACSRNYKVTNQPQQGPFSKCMTTRARACVNRCSITWCAVVKSCFGQMACWKACPKPAR